MYIIEGNIGAGKSTFLKLAEKYLPHVSIALEPLHNWQKQVYGQSLLSNFYQDPKRWAYTLETLAMMCRVREHMNEQHVIQLQYNRIRLIERSIYSGHYCFTKNSYESGFLSTLEWNIYKQWFSFLIPGKCQPLRGFIYLNVDPEIAYQRIKKRNRLSEKKLTLAYLRNIDQRHKDFLINKVDILPELENIPMLVLNCNNEFEKNEKQLQNHLDALQKFIKDTQLTIPTKKFPVKVV